jgi:hypothetical protein
MFPSTIAFVNFIEHHFAASNDCKMLRRIECAVRGEEIFVSFSIAPVFVQELMKAVFDFYAWTHLSTDGIIPAHVTFTYIQATTTVFEMKNKTCFDGLVAFGRFVDRYFSALKIMNSRTYAELPEYSSHDITHHICKLYERCQTDALPDFFAGIHVDKSKLPSRNVELPDVLPGYMCIHKPADFTHLLLLQRVAVAMTTCA